MTNNMVGSFAKRIVFTCVFDVSAIMAAPATEMCHIKSATSHINGANGSGFDWAVTTDDSAVDPNGNSVSLEEQILNGIEAKRQHDRALAVYRSSMNVLRASLGRS